VLGGLARRASVVEKLNSEDGSLLVVDSGNLFTDGRAFLRKEASQGLPLVSANLIDSLTKTSLFKQYIIKNVGAIRVAFFGLLSPNISTDIYKEGGKQFLVKDPVGTAREMIVMLHGKADVVILLSDLPSDSQQRVIKAASGIHFVLGGRDGRHMQSPL
jgi:2',3'-cyclic-nucleotide 2'-phosphodiesterase (5'-nucleotidase family)